jgi:hypothetical protein
MRTAILGLGLWTLLGAAARGDLIEVTVDTSVAGGTLNVPIEFGGPQSCVRAGTLLSMEVAETIRDDTWLSFLPSPVRQELVDQYGTLTNLQFLTDTLTQFGNASDQLVSHYNSILANLQTNNPGFVFTLNVNTNQLDNFLGQETYSLFGGTVGPDTIVGDANVSFYQVTGTITAQAIPEPSAFALLALVAMAGIFLKWLSAKFAARPSVDA